LGEIWEKFKKVKKVLKSAQKRRVWEHRALIGVEIGK